MENYDDYRKSYYQSGDLLYENYFLNRRHHRLDGPAYIRYYPSGKVEHEWYYLNGRDHRADGPASIYYHENGKVRVEAYYWNGERIFMQAHVKMMRESNDKTETLFKILNEIAVDKNATATILTNIFRNDIDLNVINNLGIFI